MEETPMNPIFDLSYQERRDNSIDAINYIELFDTNNGFTAKNVPTVQRHFTFRLNDINSWYRFAHSFIKVKCTAKSVLDTTQSHIHSDIRSIFNRVILRMNSEVVEDKSNYFFREAEWSRSCYSLDYLNTVASNMGIDDYRFFGDQIRQSPEYVTGAGAGAGNLYPEGLGALVVAQSQALVGTGTDPVTKETFRQLDTWNNRLGSNGRLSSADCGKGREYYVPLYELFNLPKVWDRCIKGAPLELELFIAPDSVCCRSPNNNMDGTAIANTATDGAVLNWVGSGITWLVPRIVPSPLAEARLNSILLEGRSIPINFEKSYVYRYAVEAGATKPRPVNEQWRIVNTASRPTKVVLFLRTQESEASVTSGVQGQFFQNVNDGSGFGGVTSVLSKANLFVNGRKVPSEDVKCTAGVLKDKSASAGGTLDVVGLPKGRDMSQLYRMYQEFMANYDHPYSRNFGMMAGTMSYNDFALNPFYCYDLSKREIAEFVGGASEISLDFTLEASTDAPAIPAMYIYALVYSESTLTLNMSEHSTTVLVR